jgi:alpha-tubulin suppressor-like RCC1 family protein
MMMRVMWTACALALAACQFPGGPARLPCGIDDVCADGHVCLDQVCVPEPSTCAASVSAGDEHTCAIRDDHTAWCWGRNDAGQLGDGTTEDRTSPVQVATRTSLVAIAPGGRHTCALGEDGSVWCWGSNDNGQLAGAADSRVPVQVVELAEVKAIASGDAHSCALLADGTMKCWGANEAGQLGNTTTVKSATPTAVNLRGITEIAAGSATTCAVGEGGSLSCWGSNGSGQLGDGTGTNRSAPQLVRLPEAVAHVAVGTAFVCALDVTGAVYCVGGNAHAQLGRPTPLQIRTPVKVALPVPAATISAGARFACATELRPGGEEPAMWCWGENQDFAVSGDADRGTQSPRATRYAGLVAISAGRDHLCMLSEAGSITCRGANSRGQLGDEHRTSLGAPPPSIGLVGVTALAAGRAHTCAVAGGKVLCWGENESGQIGDGTTTPRSRPALVEGVEPAIAVVAGDSHSCVLLADGTAMCWGHNLERQAGQGTLGEPRAVPRPVLDGTVPLAGIAQLAAGAFHTCALLDGGAVKCWGKDDSGQVLPQCAGGGCPNPQLVTLGMGAQQIAAGSDHSCARLDDDTVKCWGYNEQGQLGDGTVVTRVEPVLVGVEPNHLRGVQQLSAHGHFTCAITGGTVQCWGDGDAGQLGLGEPRDFLLLPGPTLGDVSGASKVRGGSQHACVVAAAGLQCWGVGNRGQLGDGAYRTALTPATIPAGGTVTDVAAGTGHTCAVLDGGTVTCWGDGRSGQLGNGELDRRARVAPALPCP